MKINIILLDLDGVIVDFIGGVKKRLGQPFREDSWEIENWYNMSSTEFWSNFQDHEFWANLDPFPEMQSILNLIGDKEFYLCTTPTLSPYCLSGKLEWIQKYFGKDFRKYYFTCNKELLGWSDILLIDDSDSNIKKFDEIGGQTILYPRSYNANRYIKNSFDFLCLEMEKKFSGK